MPRGTGGSQQTTRRGPVTATTNQHSRQTLGTKKIATKRENTSRNNTNGTGAVRGNHTPYAGTLPWVQQFNPANLLQEKHIGDFNRNYCWIL
ncbi:unnamed protein product [Acanthoscelides obtectus]|uniref:Uncharacterized protein n=1 Tax=Acanthoscelides obtectus TaxID=200917 RepID=A0A9P0JND4_ACAOB|nr:unnamed protein product [Acanthoscelides obtectus]CAK1625928.1 hypothetical protein AOBTE_LOCUS3475 [Acanthoscelides obtectus]